MRQSTGKASTLNPAWRKALIARGIWAAEVTSNHRREDLGSSSDLAYEALSTGDRTDRHAGSGHIGDIAGPSCKSITITRESCGSGNAKASTPGEAHELALKAAETDATKRALATFGNPFGLALYDRELAGVKNCKALSVSAPEDYRGPWLLSLPVGAGQSLKTVNEYLAALRKALTEAADIEQLFAIWERNVDARRAINRHSKHATPRGVIAQGLVACLNSVQATLTSRLVNIRFAPRSGHSSAH